MATTAEKSNPDDESTAVLPPRLHCKRKRIPKPQRHLDLVKKPEREPPGLMEKIRICIKRLENSEFSRSFFDQTQTPEFNDKFLKVLGSEHKMQMVIYGIGSIDSSERSRIQLSLAILMKKRFDWIGDMEVFDPVISLTESQVMESLGCSVLSFNEQGRREVLKPTLFFMPCCDADLYDNLLEANWTFDRLTRLLLLGNAFTFYEKFSAFRRKLHCKPCGDMNHILRVRRFTQEFELIVGPLKDMYGYSLGGLSWHFFSPADDAELNECGVEISDETLKFPSLNI